MSDKWTIPQRYELTPERLAKNDETQKEWAVKFNTPFASLSPAERIRGRALIIIRELSAFAELTEAQKTELAEAYAEVGDFIKASALDTQYKAFAEALFRDDAEWCGHGLEHQYAKKDIYSIVHEKEAVLLACNLCGFTNIRAELPKHIAKGRQERADTKSKVGAVTSIKDAISQHNA